MPGWPDGNASIGPTTTEALEEFRSRTDITPASQVGILVKETADQAAAILRQAERACPRMIFSSNSVSIRTGIPLFHSGGIRHWDTSSTKPSAPLLKVVFLFLGVASGMPSS